LKTIIYTALALLAFAANSVLCRMALGNAAIDASSFTILRLLSAMVMLAIILSFNRPKDDQKLSKGSWSSALMLFIYATCFSFAYISLPTATGALILFGAVQITMIAMHMVAGNRLHLSEWLGLSLAFGGFIYLLLPGLSTPSLAGFLLMAAAGIAWGFYTIKGQQSVNPLRDTAFNFGRTLPFIIVLVILFLHQNHITTTGLILAILSGAIASGIGYTLWYMALDGLSASEAAVVQLLVPLLAAAGGIWFVSEAISLRLMLAGLMILGGMMIVIAGHSRTITPPPSSVKSHHS